MHDLLRAGIQLSAAAVLALTCGTASAWFGSSKAPDSDGDGVADFRDECPGTTGWFTKVHSDGCPADSDFDGVFDKQDRCPATPVGSAVDGNGCPFESDGDGVLDIDDRCPGTGPGVTVNVEGCPLDTDGDGIPDDQDACPDEKAYRVGADGCAIRDADGDGVADGRDRCPNTPKGFLLDAAGCPLDSDGDGVPDSIDQCPRTAAGDKVLPNGCSLRTDCRKPEANEAVDADGCADARRFILRGITFEFDSDRLTPEAEQILRAVADTLSAYPDVNTEVQGHTDALGTDSYNQGLSERRAKSVVRFLVLQGAIPERLKPVGYGESVPVASNASPEGRDLNRRVEFRVSDVR